MAEPSGQLCGTRVLIAGASARAAAASAVRAGMSVVAADRYADADLREIATVLDVPRFPSGVLRAAAALDCRAWMYTGGLENHPRFVDRLAGRCVLWGTAARALRVVRDPFFMNDHWNAQGYPTARVVRTADGLPRDGTWLRKSLRGSGGAHVVPWTGPHDTRSPGHYFQERLTGVPCSAAFLAARGQTILLGMTEQLLAPAPAGVSPFRYGGSIGPLPLDDQLRATIVQLGQDTAAVGLVGLFGIDGLLEGGCFRPLEVNPRYTASLEILEQACGFSAVALHAAACSAGRLPEKIAEHSPGAWYGKRIVYAPALIAVPANVSRHLMGHRGAWPHPRIADIPTPGTIVPPHAPFITVYAQGPTRAAAHERLMKASEASF